MAVEILIKVQESRLIVFSAQTNVIKITIPKMADTSKDVLLLGGGIRHIRAALQYQAHRSLIKFIITLFIPFT